jgi:hypothetical protein
MNGELIPSEGGRIEFGSFRSPEQHIKEARAVAEAFRKEARRLQLFKRIGESDHLLVEGWQLLASLYHVTASIQSTRYIEIGDAHGWEATAEAIFVPTGQKISSADGMVLDDEDKWGMVSKYEWVDNKKKKVGDVAKPLQQLRSMAQTRAQSKVLSNLLKFVARMAGFATAPAEEMSEESFSPPPTAKQTEGNVISDAQAKRLFAIAKSAGKTDEQVKAVIRFFGFEHTNEITRDKYEAICAELMKSENQ